MRLCSEHPRARGENTPISTSGTSTWGTSPRTRGKHTEAMRTQAQLRNIPAHAGKTDASMDWATVNPEHPRARGENATTPPSGNTATGTSPRTRGKHPAVYPTEIASRNIPAHAGKTRLEWSVDRVSLGTSPRTRGKRGGSNPRVRLDRNIPAHAGKTMRSCSRRRA